MEQEMPAAGSSAAPASIDTAVYDQFSAARKFEAWCRPRAVTSELTSPPNCTWSIRHRRLNIQERGEEQHTRRLPTLNGVAGHHPLVGSEPPAEGRVPSGYASVQAQAKSSS